METRTVAEWNVLWQAEWSKPAVALACFIALLMLMLTAWTYRRIAKQKLVLLLALRSVAVLGALALFLQPALERLRVRRGKNHVAVLVDNSLSMDLPTNDGGPKRITTARKLLHEAHTVFERWRSEHEVHFFTFSDSLETSTEDKSATTLGSDATHTGEALGTLKQQFAARDWGAFLLISDGSDNGRLGPTLDDSTRHEIQGLGVPIHTVLVGHSDLRDVSLDVGSPSEFAFVRTVYPVQVVIRASGYDGVQTQMTLKKAGQVVQTRTLTLTEGDQQLKFDIVPEHVGEEYYEIALPVLPGEAIAQNNTQGFVLRVLRDRMRVLHVCGRPDWDVLFLRRLLKRNPNVDLISFFILRTPTDLQLVANTELSLIPFPTQELFDQEIGSFDAIIFQNFNFEPYGLGVYLRKIREFVDKGGGLVMIGGELSFSQGGWRGNPVGDALPFDLLPLPEDPMSLYSATEFRPSLLDSALDHPILRVGATRQENQQIWQKLPLLEGSSAVGSPRPGAAVLATHPTLRTADGSPMPVLAVRDVGAGRTLGLTSGASWRWAFAAEETGADGRAYERFWDNALRWLTHDPELRRLRIEIGQASYETGKVVPVTVRATASDYRPADKVEVRARWSAIDGDAVQELPLRLTNAEGEAVFSIGPPHSGAYRFSAEATLDGQKHHDEKLFLVEAPRQEMADPLPRPNLLREIARASGGSFLTTSQSLQSLKIPRARVVAIEGRRQTELWSGPWTFVLIVLALGAEWILRRRIGFR